MLSKISKCFMLIIICLRITQGSPVDSTESTSNPSAKDVLRQTKSEVMRRFMNESVDPCDDFYEFACGNYINYYPDNLFMPSLTDIVDVVNAQLKAELETDDETDTDVDRKVKRFYKSCMNPSWPSNDNGTQTVKKEQMPVLAGDTWQESDFDWVESLAEIHHRTGLQIIFGIGAINDFNDNSRNVVGIFESKSIKARSSLYDDEAYADERKRTVDNIASDLMAFDVAVDVAEQTANEIVAFEIALARGKPDMHFAYDISDLLTLTTMEDMQKKYLPDLDSKKLIKLSLDFTPTELFVDQRYVENALSVIGKTSKRIVANYMFYCYYKNFIHYHTIDIEYNKNLCVGATHDRFYKNLDNMFYRKHISADVEDNINGLWEEMRMTYQSVLQSPRLNWLQEDTRIAAVEKLNAMRLMVLSYGYKNFEQEFAQLNISDHSYGENIAAILALQGNRTRAEIHETPEPEDGGLDRSYHPANSGLNNLIKIPGVFAQQYHRFSSSYPKATNYATVGFTIGHEMLHGFDAGYKYDAQGHIRNWWNVKAYTEFQERTKCFINQYKKYVVGGQALPEMQNQAENIADAGGLRTAYAAYMKWYENASSHSLELESLPGMNYTSQQLFFISYGQWWCDSSAPDYIAVKLNSHVPEKFRVIGPLSNIKEFAMAFNCPRGSAMNPIEKCEIY